MTWAFWRAASTSSAAAGAAAKAPKNTRAAIGRRGSRGRAVGIRMLLPLGSSFLAEHEDTENEAEELLRGFEGRFNAGIAQTFELLEGR